MPLARPRLSLKRPSAAAAVSATFGHDLEGTLRCIERHIADARTRGAGLVVFPEAAIGGYLREARHDGMPSIQPPPVLADPATVFARLARAAGDTVVCVGYTEAAPEAEVVPGRRAAYASAVCLSGDGVLGHQRKVHVPPGELGVIAPGRGFTAFDTPFGRLGMVICYDKVFPEAARALALDRAETIACLAAWPVSRLRPARRMRNDREVMHFNALDVARAVENQVVWVAANHFGAHGALRFPGQAKVVDPDGRVLASTGGRAGLASARIDPSAAVARARDSISHLCDRQPVAYGQPALPAVHVA